MPEEIRYIGETALQEAYYDTLIANKNEASIKDKNDIRKGILIQNTEVKSWPTTDVSYGEVNDIEFDLYCESVLLFVVMNSGRH